MLASANRLRNSRDIARVMSRGQYAANGPVAVKALLTHATTSRAVVVVSKKVSKKATVRNRIRRRLAAILADRWATVTPGYDIVITVRADIADAPAAGLTTALNAALKRLGLITN